MPNGENRKTSMLRQFFSNPIVGVAGSIASIIGLVLAIYFYFQATHYRNLVYFVHPAKAVVVRSCFKTPSEVNRGG
jgi:hypothetical protein